MKTKLLVGISLAGINRRNNEENNSKTVDSAYTNMYKFML